MMWKTKNSCRILWGEMMTDEVSGLYAWIGNWSREVVFSQNFHKPNEHTISRADT